MTTERARDALSIGQPQLENSSRPSAAPEGRHFGRYDHLRSELLSLVVGARHQCQSADAGWKSEIILDSRRGAGLAAERAAVEHHHREPF